MKKERILQCIIDVLKESGMGTFTNMKGEQESPTPSTTLSEMGFDSLDVIDLADRIDRRLDTRMPSDVVSTWSNKSLYGIADDVKLWMDEASQVAKDADDSSGTEATQKEGDDE